MRAVGKRDLVVREGCGFGSDILKILKWFVEFVMDRGLVVRDSLVRKVTLDLVVILLGEG